MVIIKCPRDPSTEAQIVFNWPDVRKQFNKIGPDSSRTDVMNHLDVPSALQSQKIRLSNTTITKDPTTFLYKRAMRTAFSSSESNLIVRIIPIFRLPLAIDHSHSFTLFSTYSDAVKHFTLSEEAEGANINPCARTQHNRENRDQPSRGRRASTPCNTQTSVYPRMVPKHCD